MAQEREIKYLAVDFDGFITQEGVLSWLVLTYNLAQQFGDSDEVAKQAEGLHFELFRQFLQKKITFDQAKEALLRIWTKDGTRVILRSHIEKAVKALNNRFRHDLPQLQRVLSEFIASGGQVFMITGSFPTVVDVYENVIPITPGKGETAYTLKYRNSSRGKSHDILEGFEFSDKLAQESLPDWKVRALEKLTDESNLAPEDGIVLGHNSDEIPAMRRAGRGILVTTDPKYTGDEQIRKLPHLEAAAHYLTPLLPRRRAM